MKKLKLISFILFLLNFNLASASFCDNSWGYELLYETTSAGNCEKEITIPENLTTWIFEDGTFVPMAKLQGDKSYSIITDHLGTPTEAYDEEGTKVWTRELGIYGQTRKETGVENFIPFKYQGQYHDLETRLCYNRFRYYDPSAGVYVSQDPIRLGGDNPNFYAYVGDVNSWIDPFGLTPFGGSYGQVRAAWDGGEVHHMPANSVNGLSHYSGPAIIMHTDDHYRTGSHGHQGAYGASYRAKQDAYIKKGQFGKAMEMDIDDIQGDFGKKYNKHMTEAVNYAESSGYISNAEAKKLRAKCK